MLIILDELTPRRLHVITIVTLRREVSDWSSWNRDKEIHFALQTYASSDKTKSKYI